MKTCPTCGRSISSKRTLAQNKYWHSVPFKLLAESIGDSIENVKLDCMGECWGWTTTKLGGNRVPIKPHTSDMTIEEGCFFTDWIIPWALEFHRVVIPLPNEWEG